MKAQLEQARIFNAISSFNEFWNTKYFQNEPKFNGVYWRNNLPKTKDGAYVISLDEFKLIGTHWIALYENGNKIIYFVSFGVEHIPKEIKKFIKKNKNIITDIYRIQAYDSIMREYLLDLLILCLKVKIY